MSAEAAGRRADDQLRELRTALARMETSLQDLDHFPEADADFHVLVMALSGNQLASSVTRMLFQRAWQMAKFSANQSSEAHELTPSEHRRVYEAIAAGDAGAAEAAMKAHHRLLAPSPTGDPARQVTPASVRWGLRDPPSEECRVSVNVEPPTRLRWRSHAGCRGGGRRGIPGRRG